MDNLVKISNDELIKHYDSMLTRLNRHYKEGFYKWVEKGNPHVAKRLVILDEKINEVWEDCVNGTKSITMFKAGVKLYEDTVRKALENYDEKDKEIQEQDGEGEEA
jgi:hypothetical protein